VQGVGFRWFAVLAASRLGICGYARNLRDGRVEVYAVGEPQQLAALRAELEAGPPASLVTTLHEEPASFEPRYAEEFSVEHDA
jgi:acylphosphatase